MKLKNLLITGVALVSVIGLTGCQPANIQSKIRTFDPSSNYNMITKCEEVDMRENDEMNELFSKYAGYRVFYISEYTTGNKIGTSGTVCFEKPNK